MKIVPAARRFPGFPKNTIGGLEREIGENKRLRIKAPGGCLFSLFTYLGLGGFDTRSVRESEVVGEYLFNVEERGRARVGNACRPPPTVTHAVRGPDGDRREGVGRRPAGHDVR